MSRIISLSVFLFTSISLSPQTQISIDSVSANIGKQVKVSDKVAGTFITREEPVTYLNLGADYPNTKLTVVIFQKNLQHFDFVPSDH